jgi:G3E family GTPase
MRIAVLVNDFGEINIDAKLIVSVEGESVVSLANGCVCCVIRDDLLTEVLRLFEKTPLPEHIVIETSGVSNPAAVADTFLVSSAQGLVEVQNLISVLDADLFLDEQDEQEEYRVLAIEQIKVADVVVINKIDLVEPQRLSEIKSKVVTIIPRARIWETAFGVVPLDLIFDDQMSPAMEGLKESHATLAGNNEHEQRILDLSQRRGLVVQCPSTCGGAPAAGYLSRQGDGPPGCGNGRLRYFAGDGKTGLAQTGRSEIP